MRIKNLFLKLWVLKNYNRIIILLSGYYSKDKFVQIISNQTDYL